MTNTCEHVESQIPFLVDGALDDPQRGRILAHTRQCAACAEVLRFQKQLHTCIQDDGFREPPRLYFEGVLAEIHRQMLDTPPVYSVCKKRRWNRQNAASGFVAALAMLWVLSVAVPHGMPDRLRCPTGDSFRQAPRASRAQVVASVGPAIQTPRLVLVRGLGFLSADSPIGKLPAWKLQELGLLTPPPAKPERANQKIRRPWRLYFERKKDDISHAFETRVYLC